MFSRLFDSSKTARGKRVMSQVYFKDAAIVSLRDKKGFTFKFSPKINIIYGENDTGKSSLIKSLYYTLGGNLRIDKRWKNDDIISKVTMHVKGREFAFVRRDKHISIYQTLPHKKLVVASNSLSEIANHIKNIFGFSLQLVNKKTAMQSQAYPACLYLPFYIDQDDGWYKVLESFSNLAMYKDWQRNILQYHSGIRPKEYYDIQGELIKISLELEELRATLKIVQLAKKKFEDSFGRVLFDVDIDYYEDLLGKFLDKCNALNLEESKYRVKLLEALSLRDSVNQEIEDCRLQLNENDMNSLSGYEDIETKYHVLESRDKLLTILPELYEQKSALEEEISSLKSKLRQSQELSIELNDMLCEVKNELSLRDVIRSQASKEVEFTFDDQIKELLEKIGLLTVAQNEYLEKEKEFTDKKRTKKINDEFKGYLSKAQDNLSIQEPVVESIVRYSRITRSETGSRNPRTIFAYHYALLKTIDKFSTFPLLPVVVDSPKQQDLDPKLTENLISLCTEDLATKSQMIIGSVALENNMHGFNQIELTEKYSLLNEGAYEEAISEIIPFYKEIMLN